MSQITLSCWRELQPTLSSDRDSTHPRSRIIEQFPQHDAALNIVRPSVWLGPAAVTILAFSGFFKGTAVLAWLPFDLTAAAVGLVVIFCAHHASGHSVRISPWWLCGAAIVTWGFFPTAGNQYAITARLGLGLGLISAVGASLLIGRDANRRRILLWFSIWSGLAFGVVALVNADVSTGRLAAAGSNTIATGQATGLAGVALLTLVMTGGMRSMKGTFIAIAGAAFMVFTLLQTGSRGPTIAAVVALTTVATLSRRGPKKALTLAGAGIVLWMGYELLMSSSSPGAQRLQLALSGRVDNTETRRPLWNLAVESIGRDPFGLGWGNFYQAGHAGLSGERIYPHNAILEAGAEGGIWAAVILLGVLTIALKRLAGLAKAPTEAALLGIAVFLTVTSMFSGSLADQRPLFVFLALGLASRPQQPVDSRSVLPGALHIPEGDRSHSKRRSRNMIWSARSSHLQDTEQIRP